MKYLKVFVALFVAMALLNACQKEYSLEGGGLKLPVGNWEFKDSTNEYIGTMDTAYISGTGVNKELHLLGKSAVGNQVFNLTLYADSFKVGTYKASLFQTTFEYSGPVKMIYQASQLNGEFIVNISSISANLITGNFSGTALDSANISRQIFDGKFKSTFGEVNAGPTSLGVLGDSSGNCKPVVLNGIYKQGITATTANTVQVQVTVASVGAYNISTNSVNGIVFSKTGTFTTTGVQNVILNASGVPPFPGDQTFTVKFGNSQCAFTVNFLVGAAPSEDYYPLNVNNNWTFGKVDGAVSDSFAYKVISNNKNINGITYSDLAIYDVPPAAAYDSAYIRKANGNYYAYMNYSDYFFFDQPQYAETIILKDNVPQGNTWNSATVTGNIAGAPIPVSFKFTILEKGAPVTLGIFNLPDVIKVKMEAIVGSFPISATEFWYAKNVGPVYMNQGGTTAFKIGRWEMY